MFPIHPVDAQSAQSHEQLGTKFKYWFDRDGRHLLFKACTEGTGEDWSEVVACHLCANLGLPHVHYDLAAEYVGDEYTQPGVICETMAVEPVSLVLGNQLLLRTDDTYPEGNRFRVRQHTVGAVTDELTNIKLPSSPWIDSAPTGLDSALGVFVGYVMLDAWIANQDRHHENWGALAEGNALSLAPTFDHGAGLARNLTDNERHNRLTTKDAGYKIAAFSRKARSAIYLDWHASRPLTTFDAFSEFAKLCPEATETWLGQLAAIDRGTIEGILGEVPGERMSKTAQEFTLELLLENQKILLQKEPKA